MKENICFTISSKLLLWKVLRPLHSDLAPRGSSRLVCNCRRCKTWTLMFLFFRPNEPYFISIERRNAFNPFGRFCPRKHVPLFSWFESGYFSTVLLLQKRKKDNLKLPILLLRLFRFVLHHAKSSTAAFPELASKAQTLPVIETGYLKMTPIFSILLVDKKWMKASDFV